MHIGTNIQPNKRGINPSSGQKLKMSFPLKFKSFHTVPNSQEFLQEAGLHPGGVKAALKKKRINPSWRHVTTEMLLI